VPRVVWCLVVWCLVASNPASRRRQAPDHQSRRRSHRRNRLDPVAGLPV